MSTIFKFPIQFSLDGHHLYGASDYEHAVSAIHRYSFGPRPTDQKFMSSLAERAYILRAAWIPTTSPVSFFRALVAYHIATLLDAQQEQILDVLDFVHDPLPPPSVVRPSGELVPIARLDFEKDDNWRPVVFRTRRNNSPERYDVRFAIDES